MEGKALLPRVHHPFLEGPPVLQLFRSVGDTHARGLPRPVSLAQRPGTAHDRCIVIPPYIGWLSIPALLGGLCVSLAASYTNSSDTSLGRRQGGRIPVSSRPVSPLPKQRPTHELATAEFLRIPGPDQLPLAPTALTANTGPHGAAPAK